MSAILAGAAVARGLAGGETGAGASIDGALALRPQIEALAAHVHGAERILTVGLGADQITARELALKIEEGARIPTTALHLETLLHGHLAGCDGATTALVLFAADARQGARRDGRLAVRGRSRRGDRHPHHRDRRRDRPGRPAALRRAPRRPGRQPTHSRSRRCSRAPSRCSC